MKHLRLSPQDLSTPHTLTLFLPPLKEHGRLSLVSTDSPFILVGKSSDDCVVSRGRDCSQIRWTSANRLMVTGQKKCLGAQGMSVGSSISQYDCDDRSNLQKWVCRNGTLLALKDSKYYMMLKPDKSLVLSSNIGPNNEFVIRGTGAGACLKTHRGTVRVEERWLNVSSVELLSLFFRQDGFNMLCYFLSIGFILCEFKWALRNSISQSLQIL